MKLLSAIGEPSMLQFDAEVVFRYSMSASMSQLHHITGPLLTLLESQPKGGADEEC